MGYLLSNVEKGDRSKSVIVFLAGFPDNETSAWGDILPQKLAKDHRLIFLCLPDFHRGNYSYGKWGYDFDEILDRIYTTLYSLNVLDNNIQFDLFVHDWGSIIGQKYENKYPKQIRKIVLFDVAQIRAIDVPIHWHVRYFLYQFFWALCYFMSQAVSHKLGNFLFRTSYQPPIVWLGPIPVEPMPIPDCEMTVSKCYPYYYLWRAILMGEWEDPKCPACPILFMYGTNKYIMYHNEKFIKHINNTHGCRQKSFSGGHWFARSHGEEVYKEVQTFLTQK